MSPFAFWPSYLPRTASQQTTCFVLFCFFNFHVSFQADPMVLMVLGWGVMTYMCHSGQSTQWCQAKKNPSTVPKAVFKPWFASLVASPFLLTSDENIWPPRDQILSHSQPTTRRANTTTDFEMIMPPQLPTPLELLFSLRAHINSSSVRQTEQGPFSFTHHKRDLWWGNYPAQVTQTVNKVRTKMQILDFWF